MSLDLIARLEAAEAPSVALDAEICWTLERDRAISAFWRGAMGRPAPLPDEFSRLPRGLGMASLEVGSPNYTASLDAALALASRVLDQRGPININICLAGSAQVVIDSVGPCNPVIAQVVAATPALALCAAILRAKGSDQ